MDPREFVRVARALAASDDPASRRSALSRLYYALYHVAGDHLAALGVRLPRDHRGHELVWSYLYHSGVDRLIHAGAQLRRRQGIRLKADYALRDPHADDAAVLAFWLDRTAALIVTLDAAVAEPDVRARAVAAIAVWRARGDERP